jgi:hypothetical protein
MPGPARLAGAAIALLLAAGAATAAEPVEVLSEALVAALDPARERSLVLTPGGDAARFRDGDGTWEEARPPLILDLDRDGTRDFVVMVFQDPDTLQQAFLIHEWGQAADAFGPAVFYVIMDPDGSVAEWAGTHRLRPPSPR